LNNWSLRSKDEITKVWTHSASVTIVPPLTGMEKR